MSALFQDVGLMFEADLPSRSEIAADENFGSRPERPTKCCRRIAAIDEQLNDLRPHGFRCTDCPGVAALAVAA